MTPAFLPLRRDPFVQAKVGAGGSALRWAQSSPAPVVRAPVSWDGSDPEGQGCFPQCRTVVRVVSKVTNWEAGWGSVRWW